MNFLKKWFGSEPVAKKYESSMYEPKRESLWLLHIEGIDSFIVKNAQRPNVFRNDEGKFELGEMSVALYDPISPSGAHQVFDWITKDDRRQGSLKLLNSVGNVVEVWILTDLKLMHANFGALYYEASGPAIIHISVKPREVTLVDE